MVKNHHLLVALAVTFILMTLIGGALAAWTGTYHLGHEWAKIWINQDGTIDLFYNISITLDSGDDINYVFVGQPKPDFTIGQATDQYGHTLEKSDASSGSDYKVQVRLYSPLRAGQTIWFTLITNVANMISEDAVNPGNVGMEFTPCYWDVRVDDLRISVVLPEGVNKGNVKCTPDWDNAYNDPDEENRLVIYWEKHEQFSCGVSWVHKSHLAN